MQWSHNDLWMVTADHGGYIKYWQSNMNNVKMYQGHKEAIRGLRWALRADSQPLQMLWQAMQASGEVSVLPGVVNLLRLALVYYSHLSILVLFSALRRCAVLSGDMWTDKKVINFCLRCNIHKSLLIICKILFNVLISKVSVSVLIFFYHFKLFYNIYNIGGSFVFSYLINYLICNVVIYTLFN